MKSDEGLVGSEDPVVTTMIGDSDDETEGKESMVTIGNEAAYDINTGVDDLGDEEQLIPSRKKTPPKK